MTRYLARKVYSPAMAIHTKKSEVHDEIGQGFVRRRIDLDEGHLSYLCRPGGGPTVILIPGSFDDSFAFKDIVNLLDREMGLVVVELRGHGESWPPPKDGSIEQFARDILSVVDEMRLESFFIGGHSIGGMVALQVAGVRPWSVRGVISIEGWTNHHAQHDAFDDQTINTLSARQLAKRAQLRQRVMERWSAAEIAAFRTIWRKWDGYDFLSRTDLPILELYGDRGRERPSLDKLHIPERDNITVQWMSNASHCLHIECPHEVAQACSEFIKRVEETGQ